MPPTARQLNRATLHRQLLLEREPLPVTTAVGRVLALQAQEPVSPYVALWNRVAGFDPTDLDDAFARGELVKATTMRITLHAVRATDHPVLHTAMTGSLRGSRVGDRRFTGTGVPVAVLDALVPDVLAFLAEPRSNAETEAFLDERHPGHGRRLWWAMRTFAPVRRAPTGGHWSFDAVHHRAADAVGNPEPIAAVAELVRRYLAAFGPATTGDLRRFTMLQAPVIAGGLAELGEQVVHLAGPGGERLLDLAGLDLPDDDTTAPPRLLGMWDNVLLAHVGDRVLPAAHRKLVARSNGDVLPTVLVGGAVAGVWRPVEAGVEVSAFAPLADDVWAGLAAEAADLRALFAAREAVPYRRFAHWWDKGIPAAQVRVL